MHDNLGQNEGNGHVEIIQLKDFFAVINAQTPCLPQTPYTYKALVRKGKQRVRYLTLIPRVMTRVVARVMTTLKLLPRVDIKE
jgi:hypothetical protein